jgi:hypothetical protein
MRGKKDRDFVLNKKLLTLNPGCPRLVGIFAPFVATTGPALLRQVNHA